VFDPPAVGKGIRTLTFDPDGLEGPRQQPDPGDAFIFAPEGEIDAGEAGISAKNVILGATEIVNAQNISFSQGSVGVPVDSGGTSLGSLAGAGALAETAKLAEESTLDSAKERVAQDMAEFAEAFVPTWLRVEVIGFYEEDKKS
jgi:hypothetical protein